MGIIDKNKYDAMSDIEKIICWIEYCYEALIDYHQIKKCEKEFNEGYFLTKKAIEFIRTFIFVSEN